MSALFNSNPIPKDTDFAIVQQLRGLVTELDAVKTQLAGLTQSQAAAVRAAATGSIVNFLRNADLNTSDSGRREFTYTTPDNAANVCSFWYSTDSASTGPFTDSDIISESPEAIAYVITGLEQGSIMTGTPDLSSVGTLFDAGMVTQRCIVVGAGAAGANLDTIIDAFIDSQNVTLHDNAGTTVVDANVLISDPGQDTVWDKSGGVLWFGGAQTLLSPLQKNYCRPGVGNNIFIVFNVRLNATVGAEPIPDDYMMRMSIWDNTTGQQKIIEGAPITITATLDRGSGAVERNYVVRYFNASGDTFLSSVSSPAVVTGTPSPTNIDPGQVSVVFPMYPGIQSVQVFRSDDATSLSDFYLIDTISTGINNVQDNGGRSGVIYNFTDDNWKSDAILIKLGTFVLDGWVPLSFHILTPATYDVSQTNDFSQWLRADVLDETGAVIDIPPMAIQMDFFGLSYRPGTWQPGADDVQAPGDFESNFPSPSGGIPTGPPDDPGGGGSGGPKDGGGFLPA